MKYLSDKMLSILERLTEMFPGDTYQTRLDYYLSNKGITDAAQLEKLYPTIQFSKGTISMKNFLNTVYNICVSIGQTRAACALARMGRYEEAKTIMLSK